MSHPVIPQIVVWTSTNTECATSIESRQTKARIRGTSVPYSAEALGSRKNASAKSADARTSLEASTLHGLARLLFE